jgi:2-methylisocitrate lyase-like PEP mutase family enzyme
LDIIHRLCRPAASGRRHRQAWPGSTWRTARAGHLVDPASFAEKVTAAKRRSPAVFINARVDNIWFGEQATVDAVLRRVNAYRAAVDAAVNVAKALRDGSQVSAATPYWEMQSRLVSFSQRTTG